MSYHEYLYSVGMPRFLTYTGNAYADWQTFKPDI